jgi:hypothetical protein
VSWVTDILTVIVIAMIAALAALAATIMAYLVWCHLIAPVIGRTAGAIERRLRPITLEERRQAVADERAARDYLRPHGSLEAVSTVHAPATNGYHETYRSDSTA